MGIAPDIAAVEIQVGGDLSGRKRWKIGVILRAQQALLFGADQCDQNRTPRRLRQRRYGFGHRHNLCDTGCVIHRPVVNDIAFFVWRANPKMIVVCRVNDDFVFQHRVASRDQAEDVSRLHTTDGHI